MSLERSQRKAILPLYYLLVSVVGCNYINSYLFKFFCCFHKSREESLQSKKFFNSKVNFWELPISQLDDFWLFYELSIKTSFEYWTVTFFTQRNDRNFANLDTFFPFFCRPLPHPKKSLQHASKFVRKCKRKFMDIQDVSNLTESRRPYGSE